MEHQTVTRYLSLVARCSVWWTQCGTVLLSSSRPAAKESGGVEIFSFKPGHVQQYLASSPQPFPASLMTPLSVSVTAAPAPSFPSSHSAHAQYIQSFSSPAASAAFAPFSDSVSLSLIHSNLNVINSSSSVIPRVGPGFLSSVSTVSEDTKMPSKSSPSYHHTVTVSSQASGPLTRSRKRRLFEGDNFDKNFGKTKVHRVGTIVIE